MKWLLILTIFFSTILFFCSKKKALDQVEAIYFAIYLTQTVQDFTPKDNSQLDHFQLLDPPFLTDADIISYEWATHVITYTDAVHQKIFNHDQLLHQHFVVTAFGEKIYWGQFVDNLELNITENPVIRLIPRPANDRNTQLATLVIEAAFPVNFSGANNESIDYRNNAKIYFALKKAGKLIP